MKKRTHADTPRPDPIAGEAEADFAERQRLVDESALVEVRQGAEHAPTDERLTGDADTTWDAATDSADAFPGHVPNTDVNEVDLMGAAAGLTYADDEPLDYSKVDARDANRWELNPASATDAPPDEDDAEDEDDEDDLLDDDLDEAEAGDEDEALEDE